MQIVFLHGLETGPHGNKYQALKSRFGTILAPDCSGVMDVEDRLEIIQASLANEPGPFLVVGSSMGGLMAMLWHMDGDNRIAGMVLCAPALHRHPAGTFSAGNLPPTKVIHGRQDEVVPLSSSQFFGDKLIAVDDDHRLSGSVDLMLDTVAEMLEEQG